MDFFYNFSIFFYYLNFLMSRNYQIWKFRGRVKISNEITARGTSLSYSMTHPQFNKNETSLYLFKNFISIFNNLLLFSYVLYYGFCVKFNFFWVDVNKDLETGELLFIKSFWVVECVELLALIGNCSLGVVVFACWFESFEKFGTACPGER